jgi:hypothetical protein
MKSSTYDDSSGMPATPEKALCGSVSAKNGEWQPISTAPRDQRRVLVWIDDGPTKVCSFAHLWFYSTDGRLGGGAEGYNGQWNITHWMPLPEPPNTTN